MSNLAQSKASEFGDVLASGLLMHCGRGLAQGSCGKIGNILSQNLANSDRKLDRELRGRRCVVCMLIQYSVQKVMKGQTVSFTYRNYLPVVVASLHEQLTMKC